MGAYCLPVNCILNDYTGSTENYKQLIYSWVTVQLYNTGINYTLRYDVPIEFFKLSMMT